MKVSPGFEPRLREYPEQVHHPKEDQYLFARLRDRTNELDETFAELESQHGQGEALVRELEHALTRYELEGSAAFPAFRDLVEKFAQFYFRHMRLEEEVILPAAKRLLTPEGWAVVDATFAGNRDPFAGADLQVDLEKLFLLIVNINPAPDGQGAAM